MYAQAVRNFNNNRFTAAVTEFKEVHGRHAIDAQDYIVKIDAYLEAIRAAEFATARPADEVDLKSLNFAIEQYHKAINIKPHGPSNPEEKLSALEERKIQLEDGTPPRKGNQPVDSGSRGTTSVEDATILAEGKKAYARNDFDTAQNLFEKLEGANQTADEYLDKIARYWSAIRRAKQLSKSAKYEEARLAFLTAVNIKSDGPHNPRAGALQMELSEGLEQYYSGDYEAAIQHLDDYLKSNGEQPSKAHFYLGASKLARSFVTGDDSSRQAGLGDLRSAKQAGYKPDPQVISPRIIQAYNELTF